MHTWIEDDYTPREDVLSSDFAVDADVLPVAHPEWFRIGDVIRIGEEDLYDTGERDEWGNPVFRVHNEAVKVIAEGMRVRRAVGENAQRPAVAGQPVLILASDQ